MATTTPMRRSGITRLRRVASRSWRGPVQDGLTACHVVVVMLAVESLVRFVRLPRLSRLLGVPIDLGRSAGTTVPLPWEQLPPLARRQLRLTTRVATRWPFGTGSCLRRALVGGHLVRRLDPVMRLGLTRVGDAPVAHAWLEIDGRALEPIDEYVVFESPRHAAR